MTLPLATMENCPHIYLQTEVRMIERTQFSKTLTSLTSNICSCLMGLHPHQMRMWGQNMQNSHFSLGRHSGCHYCCSQSHDLRAVPDRLRLMFRHLQTTTSLLLLVNMLTLAEPLMLNHFIPSVRLKEETQVCEWLGSLTHTHARGKGRHRHCGARPNWHKLMNNKQEEQDQALEEQISYDQERSALQLMCNTKNSMTAFQLTWITQKENAYTHSLFSKSITQDVI